MILALGLFTITFTACGLGGPGDTQNDAFVPPRDARADAQNQGDAHVTPDARVPVVQSLDASTLRHVYLGDTLGQTYADLRPLADCQAGRVPNADCVPLEILWNGTGFVAGGGALTSQAPVLENPLVLYGTAAMDATVQAVAEAALELGYTDLWVLTGGIEAWRAAGYYEDVSYEAIRLLYYPIPAGVFIIDTDDATTYAAGHIAGALHLDAEDFFYDGELVNGGAALSAITTPGDGDILIFYCVNSGCAASEAACEGAELMGYPTILHYKDGFQDWEGEADASDIHTGPSP